MHATKHAFSSIPLLAELRSASSGFGVVLIMLSIVSLLYPWETTVETTCHSLPPTLMPVIESMSVKMVVCDLLIYSWVSP